MRLIETLAGNIVQMTCPNCGDLASFWISDSEKKCQVCDSDLEDKMKLSFSDEENNKTLPNIFQKNEIKRSKKVVDLLMKSDYLNKKKIVRTEQKEKLNGNIVKNVITDFPSPKENDKPQHFTNVESPVNTSIKAVRIVL